MPTSTYTTTTSTTTKRYRTASGLDDQVAMEGDGAFVGLNSYNEETTLQEGIVSTAKNVRMDSGKIRVRGGLDFLAGSVTLTYASGTEQVFGSELFSSPTDQSEWILNATKSKAILWNKGNTSGKYVSYYGATCASGSVTHSANKFTISSHTFQTGDAVQLTTSGSLPTELSTGTTYYVIDHHANEIKFATSLANATAGTVKTFSSAGSGTHTVTNVVTAAQNVDIVQSFQKVFIFRSGARPLVWDGVMTDTNGDGTVDSTFKGVTMTATDASSGIAMPNAEWGLAFRNRIITPWTDDSDNSIVMSDLLDHEQFPNTGKHYINKGMADFLVGISPYQEDQLLIFNRHSIHIFNNVTTTTASNSYEITRQYGCVARKTIVQSGANTFFLSDAGVMVVTPGVDPAKGLGIAISKAMGEQKPMSEPINDFIQTINFTPSVVEKACAIVHDNKLFMAVPTGSSTDNDSVMVYDLLTDQWISIDSFGEAAFSVEDFVVAAHGSNPERKRLFITNKTGWYLYEENTLDDSGREIGSTSESGTTAITGQVITRSYVLGELGQKRFKRGQLACEVSNGDAFTIKSVTREPDSSDTVRTITGTATEEQINRFSIKRHGYACSVQIDVTAGRPTFRHVVVEGTPQFRTPRDVE